MIALLLALAVSAEPVKLDGGTVRPPRSVMATALSAAAPPIRFVAEVGKAARATSFQHEGPGDVQPIDMPATFSTTAIDPDGLRVQLLGPDDYVQGSSPPFVAVCTGSVIGVKWKVTPDVPGLTIMPGRMTAIFSNQRPGVYRMLVAVTGPGGTVDLAEREFEILERPAQEPEPPVAAKQSKANRPAQPALMTPVAGAEQDFVAQLTGWVNAIPTNNRAQEARVIGSCLKGTAARIKTKTFPAGSDPLADVQRQIGMGLVGNPVAWQSLFQNLRAEAVQIGTTPEELAPWLLGVGDIMASMR